MQSLELLKGKKVFLTGHTGFKGAWMLQVLHKLGAIVKGYALAPENDTDLYHQIKGDELCTSEINDIRNLDALQKSLLDFQPDFVIHMAAQALVKEGYANPVATFDTNVMGTVNVLESIRQLEKRCVGVMITTDKVYHNPEDGRLFKEDDKLGGYDPYSASKAADEIVIDSYRNSFFNNNDYDNHQKSIASVRAGNVIGGGDFSANRIIPDIVRAIESNQPVHLRNPKAVRPWQLVLEPVIAYLQLAVKMYNQPVAFNESYNIGPEEADILSVEEVTQLFIKAYGDGKYEIEKNPNHPHEAQLLFLDNNKIKAEIGFTPQLSAKEAITWTADWYADNNKSASEKCEQQIVTYLRN